MNNFDLEQLLNQKLDPTKIKDYTFNGLQIQGKSEISKIVVGVTATQALIDFAIAQQADAILVHHGYFWANESVSIRGMKYHRISSLIKHDINLYAYHLPVDYHRELGNNVVFLTNLGATEIVADVEEPIIFHGKIQPTSIKQLKQQLESLVKREIIHVGNGLSSEITNIAMCSGGGQGFIDQAYQNGAQVFISGEISEKTTHSAIETGNHFFAIGHHSSETWGIEAVGQWLSLNYDLEIIFKDIFNIA